MNKKGFTLIEIMVVVFIIAIIAAIALPFYRKAVERSKAAEALQILASVASSMERARMANGEYPETLADLDITVRDSGGNIVTGDSWQSRWFFFQSIIDGDNSRIEATRLDGGGSGPTLIGMIVESFATEAYAQINIQQNIRGSYTLVKMYRTGQAGCIDNNAMLAQANPQCMIGDEECMSSGMGINRATDDAAGLVEPTGMCRILNLPAPLMNPRIRDADMAREMM